MKLYEKFRDYTIVATWHETLRVGYFIFASNLSAIDCIFSPKIEFCRYYNIFDLVKEFHQYLQIEFAAEVIVNIYLFDTSQGQSALKLPVINNINFIFV